MFKIVERREDRERGGDIKSLHNQAPQLQYISSYDLLWPLFEVGHCMIKDGIH